MAPEFKNDVNRLKWEAFVAALGKSDGAEAVAEALKSEVGEINDAAITKLGDAEITPDAELIPVLTAIGIDKGSIRQAIEGIRNVQVPVPTLVTTEEEIKTTTSLPGLPGTADDFLSVLLALKVEGELKVEPKVVLAGTAYLVSHMTGLYELPEKLLKRMLSYADKMDDGVGSDFLELEDMVRSHNYGALLDVRSPSRFAGKEYQQQLLDRLGKMGDVISAHFTVLEIWYKQKQALSNDLANVGEAIANALSGSRTPVKIPIMAPVRAANETSITALNSFFSGYRHLTAMAMASESRRISEIIVDKRLPGVLGYPSFKEMVCDLGIETQTTGIEFAKALMQYVLAIINSTSMIGRTQREEARYYEDLYELGLLVMANKAMFSSSVSTPQPPRSREFGDAPAPAPNTPTKKDRIY